MKEFLFIIKRHGNDKYGNKLYHVYGASYFGDDQWIGFSPSTLESLGFGRVIRGEYITTNMYRHEIVEVLDKIYKDRKHSFLFL
jgi:hypothetical protein